jgi:hypothetical protein
MKRRDTVLALLALGLMVPQSVLLRANQVIE